MGSKRNHWPNSKTSTSNNPSSPHLATSRVCFVSSHQRAHAAEWFEPNQGPPLTAGDVDLQVIHLEMIAALTKHLSLNIHLSHDHLHIWHSLKVNIVGKVNGHKSNVFFAELTGTCYKNVISTRSVPTCWYTGEAREHVSGVYSHVAQKSMCKPRVWKFRVTKYTST